VPESLKSIPRFHRSVPPWAGLLPAGEIPEALEEFETVLKLNPQDEQARKFAKPSARRLQQKK
jgi:hypothetical protein